MPEKMKMDFRSSRDENIEKDMTEEYVPVWKVIAVYFAAVALISGVVYKFF